MVAKLIGCLRIVLATFVLQLKAASYNLRRIVFWKNAAWRCSKQQFGTLWLPNLPALKVSGP